MGHNDDGRRLYVGNLHFELTERELRDAFAIHVGVERVELLKDKMTGLSRGFGFVTLVSGADVPTAIDNLHGTALRGRALRVNLAKPRVENRRDRRRNHD